MTDNDPAPVYTRVGSLREQHGQGANNALAVEDQ